MRLDIYHSKLADMAKAKQVANGFVVVLCLSVLVQSMVVFQLMDKQRIVLLPPTIANPAWLESHQVSPAYLESMAQFHVGLLLNVTPDKHRFSARADSMACGTATVWCY